MSLNLTDAGPLPDNIEEEVREHLEDLVWEVFIDTAHEDYLSARFMALNGMQRHFYWCAMQTMEKYFKAYLLFNGYKVKDKGHKIIGMFDTLKRDGKIDFLNDLNVPEGFESSGWSVEWGNVKLRDYVDKINDYGSPSSRYDCVGYQYMVTDLFKLDCFVSQFGQGADKILADNKELKKYLYDFNYFYSTDDHEDPSLVGISLARGRVTKIEQLLNGLHGNTGIYKRWISKNIQYDQRLI